MSSPSKVVSKDDNMADDVEKEKQESCDFSSVTLNLHGSDTEVVIHREVFDSCSNLDDEKNEKSTEKINPDLESESWRWTPTSFVNNSDDLDKDSHIESVVDKSTFSENEKCIKNEDLERTSSTMFNSKGLIQTETVTKLLESQVTERSPDMEFRHRYSTNERLSARDEETRVLQSNDNSSGAVEVVEPSRKSHSKVEESPVIKEEASEQDLHDGVRSK